MSKWLLRWILNVVGIILIAYIIDGFNVTAVGAIFGSIILGLVNATIRPVLLILTLPLNLLTLGLFTLVINGLMLWLVSLVIKGFDFTSFGAAILTALLLMVVSAVISYFVKDE
jgi:putative membrane protein